jgi:SAM-dependent methyltransferase
MIAWCREHLASGTMRFEHADVYNSLYNPNGSREPYRLPVEDASTDVVTSQSLYTHLLADDVRRYTEESARVLAPGGTMAMTVFCLEHVRSSPEFGGRWTFEHRVGDAFVESRRVPEAAVAYEEDFLIELARDAGFDEIGVERMLPQSWLVARKRSAQNGGPPERDSR